MELCWCNELSANTNTKFCFQRFSYTPTRRKTAVKYSNGFLGITRAGINFCRRQGMAVTCSSSKSQAHPPRLETIHPLPSVEVDVDDESLAEDTRIKTLLDQDKTIYRVALTTSRDVGSDISDINAGVLLCLIGENGKSLLQRAATVTFMPDHSSYDSQNVGRTTHHKLRFQRGCTDIVTFCGPDIGNLAALWIGPESGSWGLAGLSVMTIPAMQYVRNRADIQEKDVARDVLSYTFSIDEILLGDGGEPAVELRPSKVQASTGNDMFSKLSEYRYPEMMAPTEDASRLRNRSSREYKNLKLSMLLYDGILVAFITFLTATTGSQEISVGFATGGVIGFFYLLLLQRAVDRLPSPYVSGLSFQNPESDESSSELTNVQDGLNKNGTKNLFSGFKGPLTGFSWIIALIILVSRYIPENVMISLKPQELLAGAAGFLTCKLATVFAAFRTLNIDQEDSNL